MIGGREAAEVVHQCDKLGFAGTIYPVHPSKTEIEAAIKWVGATKDPDTEAWVPSAHALKEAQNVIREFQIDAGQQALF